MELGNPLQPRRQDAQQPEELLLAVDSKGGTLIAEFHFSISSKRHLYIVFFMLGSTSLVVLKTLKYGESMCSQL